MSQPQTTGRTRRRKSHALGLGLFLGLVGVLLVAMLVSVWQAVEEAIGAGDAQPSGDAGAQPETVDMSFLGIVEMDVTAGTALLILVALVGALGSFIHAATSFVEYVGNERLETSWTWWYVLRLPIGASLALVLYVAFRGGLFATSATTGDVNIYGVAALAALAGLFSKQATTKLEELFTTLFRVAEGKGDERLQDSLTRARPTVTGTEPPRLTAGAEAELIVRGTGFDAGSQVRLTNLGTGEVLEAKTTFADATRLSVLLTTEDLVESGRLEVVVVNPPPGGGTSAPIFVDIDPAESVGDVTVEEPPPEPPPVTDAEAEAEAEAESAAEAEFGTEPPPPTEPPPEPPATESDSPPPRGG